MNNINSIISQIKKDKLYKKWSTDESTVKIIERLHKTHHPKEILELGTFLGNCTLAFLKNSNSSTKIYTVDILPLFNKYYSKLKSYYKKRIIYEISSINNFFTKLPSNKTFDFVFVDADHLWKAITNDIGKVITHVHKDSVLVFHDADSPPFPGVKYSIKILSFFNSIFLNKYLKIYFLPVIHRDGSNGKIAVVTVKEHSYQFNKFLAWFFSVLSLVSPPKKLRDKRELERILYF